MDDDVATVISIDRPQEAPVARLWHVTLTVGGEQVDAADMRNGLERLSQERPFLLSARYSAVRAELRYWEEAVCLDDAAAMALRLWGEHRGSAGLPAWQVTGLEVVERDTFQWQAGQRTSQPALVPAGGIRPF